MQSNKIIQDILNLKDLKPSNKVNSKFNNLVSLVINNPNLDQELTKEEIIKLQIICSQAESELEIYWSNRIINSEDPKKEIALFPYLKNYQELTKREIKLLEKTGLILNKNKKVLFIGSGPLPLSCMILHLLTKANIDQMDISPKAIENASQLSKAINFKTKLINASGETCQLNTKYDLVVIAGLAGKNIAEKQAIINNITQFINANGKILIRSAKGSRSLLYPSFNAKDIKNIQLNLSYHPKDEIINSVFIFSL